MILTPEKDKIVIKDWQKKEVYLYDAFGINTDDKLQIKMQSGKQYILDIQSVKAITEARNDNKYKESGWFLVTLTNPKEVN
jgi:hypothetical protein